VPKQTQKKKSIPSINNPKLKKEKREDLLQVERNASPKKTHLSKISSSPLNLACKGSFVLAGV
jgi:hypothetical protein